GAFNRIPRFGVGSIPGLTNGASGGIGIKPWKFRGTIAERKSRQQGGNPSNIGMLLLISRGTSLMIFESIFGAGNLKMYAHWLVSSCGRNPFLIRSVSSARNRSEERRVGKECRVGEVTQ